MHNEHFLISELFTLQCLILLILLIFTGPFGLDVSKSIIAGGLMYILPNTLFGCVVQSSVGCKSADQFVKAMRRWQVVKFIFTAVIGFIITCLPYHFDYLMLFVTFMLMMLSHVGVLAHIFKKQRNTSTI